VLTRSANLALDGAQVVGDFQQALDACSGQPAWVMGGGEVYKMALPYADLVARTQIALDVPDADTFAPELDQRWEQVWISDSRRSQNGTPYTFELWSQKS
jgi:dihydrofolate reductase